MTTDKIQLEENEYVLAQVRQHWFILALNLSGVILGTLFPFLFFFIPESVSAKLPIVTTIDPTGLFITLYAGWLLLMWMALFNIWTNYYLDVWTITNIRFIAIDQKSFFSRSMASFRLDRLQDVTVTVDGLLPTLLDYGTLELQTAGEARNFKAHGLPHPSDLKAFILNSTDHLMAKMNNEPRAEV